MVVNVVIRLALTGETIYEHTFPAVEELRVWELRQHFCLVIGSDTEISLLAIKRRLRPPTLDERADILYYVSICHRYKLWKLVSNGKQLQSTTGKRDKICTIVRAIEANYVEMSENYSCPDTVQTLLWAQCDPNHCGADQRLPLSQAIRSGDDRALDQLLRAKAYPRLTEQGQEAPLLLAIQTGSSNYVRLLLQSRAVPVLPDEAAGSEVPSQARTMEMTQVLQLASSFPEIVRL